jgi:hypothetical protein
MNLGICFFFSGFAASLFPEFIIGKKIQKIVLDSFP